jgi:NTP pyrophosphatase (non-canonical NTP hydrolase)
MDEKTTLKQLKDQVQQFCEERDWDQYHDAKELAIGITVESAELLDHFRFKTKEQIQEMMTNQNKREEISEELSDILYFILRFAQLYNIDIKTSFDNKMKKNTEKYSIEKAKGKNEKYNEL